MSYIVRLRENGASGRIVGELGPFPSQATAIAQAKGLAPTTADHVAVTVEPKSARKNPTRKKNPLPMTVNPSDWHGRVLLYPKGVMTGRGSFHEGPDDFSITKTGYYVWDGHGSPSGHGKWSLLGPFKDKAKAAAAAAKLHGKKNPAKPNPKKKAGATVVSSDGTTFVIRVARTGSEGTVHRGDSGALTFVDGWLASYKGEVEDAIVAWYAKGKKSNPATGYSHAAEAQVLDPRSGSVITALFDPKRFDADAAKWAQSRGYSVLLVVEDRGKTHKFTVSPTGQKTKSNPHPTFAPSQPGRRRIPPRNRVSLGEIPGRPNPSAWNPRPFQAGDGPQNLIMVNPAGKLPTYKQAMSKLYDAFAARGYKMSPASLKIPHATHPHTDVRFWFRPQEVYSSMGAKGDAHTVTGHAGIDVRKYVGSDQSLASLVNWLEKHGQPMR